MKAPTAISVNSMKIERSLVNGVVRVFDDVPRGVDNGNDRLVPSCPGALFRLFRLGDFRKYIMLNPQLKQNLNVLGVQDTKYP
jgi:hypothetical protein